MTTVSTQNKRIVSGMRTTGRLHLGHYHGVLKNWLNLQHEYECFFFAADLHALTTHYEDPSKIEQNTWEMLIDWLAVGINPVTACVFIQSTVAEHSELHLLLSMLTPLSWLERVPTYKDQQEKLKAKDLATYGFLGYPLLQTADVLLYKANYVPVGEDQVAHIEVAREIARRFNHLYGREANFVELAESAVTKLGKKNAKLYRQLRRAYQEQGDHEAIETGRALLDNQQNLALADKERLFGYLEGGGKLILPEPDSLLTVTPKLVGLDGQKMSKSYHNTIELREDLDSVTKKLRTMPTDPARVKRTDPGEPEKCPLWQFHLVYSSDEVKAWAANGCRTAGIGCLDCKQPVIDSICNELRPIQEAAKEYENDANLLKNVVAQGTEIARDEAEKTMTEVREAMGLMV